MTDPLTASEIAVIAFTTVVEKLAESCAEGTLAQVTQKLTTLKSLIWEKLRSIPKAEAALAKADEGSKENIDCVAAYLNTAMYEDDAFAEQIRILAREIQQQNDNISRIQGKNIQNLYGSEGYQINKSTGTIMHTGQGNINITNN